MKAYTPEEREEKEWNKRIEKILFLACSICFIAIFALMTLGILEHLGIFPK